MFAAITSSASTSSVIFATFETIVVVFEVTSNEFITAIASHQSVKVALSGTTTAASSILVHESISIGVVIVHATTASEFLVSSSLVANAVLELAAAVAPTAAVAGATHDRGRGPEIIKGGSTTTVALHVS